MTLSFVYYVFAASAVFFYGIEINRTTQATKWSGKIIFLTLTKLFFSIECTTVLTMLISNFLLVPMNLVELIPLIALLFYIVMSASTEIIMRISTGKRIAEFSLSFLIIILSLSESVTILDSFLIPLFCILSFAITTLILQAVTFHIKQVNTHSDENPKIFFVFFSLVLIIIASLVFDVTWLNPGVLP